MSAMSEELLSALLDGECTAAEAESVLAAIERSPALKARWDRMCLTRDALAGVAIAKGSFDFASGVMAAIASEAATEVNPKVVSLRRPVTTARPASQPAPAVQPRQVVARSRRWQPVAGLAAAASIAAVALVGGRTLLNAPINGPASGGSATAGTVQVAASSNPNIVRVSADGDISGAATQDSRWTQLDGETARQLNDYLLEHSNSRADAGMGGSLGYARLAVRTADYRPADGSR